MIHSPDWITAKITIGADDDLSSAVDLGKPYESMDIMIPTIDSANLTCYVSEEKDGTYFARGNSVTVAAGTGLFSDTWDIGAHQYIKIGTSASQTVDRVFRVRGVRS